MIASSSAEPITAAGGRIHDAIRVQGLSRRFDGDPPIEVLRSVDLSIATGDYVAITGPSGSGKSTLLNLIGILDRPSAGSIHLSGHDIGLLDAAERARIRGAHVGFVFQAFHLLDNRSALENVEMAFRYQLRPKVGRHDAAQTALERVGLGHRLDASPRTLSGGERQRVAIARAIVTGPDVLLADEPTGNLDTRTGAEILDLFDDLHLSGLTLAVITHDHEVSSRASRVVHLRDGHITNDTRHRPLAVPTDAAVEPATAERTGVPRRIASALADTLTSLLSRPARTALTALGTVLGIASLVATIGIADTGGNRIVSRFDALSATEVVVEPTRTLDQDNSASLGWTIEDRLEPLNGVAAAGGLAPIAEPGLTRTIPLAGSSEVERRDIDLIAASPGLFEAVLTELEAGRVFNRLHHDRADAVAVLGPGAAQRLGITRPETSPSIFVADRQLTVIGTIAPNGVRAEPGMLDAIIVPSTWAEQRYGPTAPSRVVIRTEPGASALIADQAPVALNPNDPTALRARRAAEPVRVREEVQQDLNSLLILLGTIALIIGGLGIANVTLVSVLERTGEIGLRSALGGRRSTIAAQFLTESAILGLIAGIIGTSIGTLIVTTIATIRDWTPVLTPWIPLAAPALGALVGVLAGAYPAWRAASIDPATALRTGT